MTTIVTRAGKGSPLTHTEVDTNFTNLNTNKLEAGAIASGTAALPSISFVSDPNTGVFSPGADQLAVATNGTEKLIVLSNGNVGIGTSSPSQSLQVVGAIASVGQAPALTASSTFFDYITALNTARFAAVGNTTGTAAPIYFSQYSSNGSVGRDAVVIDSSGRVGIGTTGPNRKLEVSDASADNFIRVNTTGAAKSGIEFANGGTVYSQLYFNNVAPYDLSLLQQYSTGSLILGTNSTERARIDSSGRLLIGTSSKSATASTTAKGVIGLGGGGALICAEASSLANNGTVDITVSTGGVHYFTGLLQVNNINAAFGSSRTQSLISVLGDTQSGTITTSTLHTANGSSGQSFTITYVATGILRFTNTSGSTCNVQISYMGGGINAS